MSLLRYGEYKDSGVTWLGDVPTHWDSWKLFHAFGLIGSGTTPPTDEQIWYADGTIPWITTGELRENFVATTSKSVTDAAVKKFPALRVHPAGSLAIAMYGATIGRLGVLGVDATTNQACCVLSQPRSLDVRFVFYWLLGFKQKLIDLFATGGGQPNISKETIASLRVPAPELGEQSAIAAFLDRETGKIDALIAEQEKLLTLLAEKRQATISHAVTRGLNPNAPMKDSGIAWLGDVPAHWAVRSLKSIVSTPITDGPHETPQFLDDGVPFVSAEAVSGGTINFEKIRAYISLEDDERYSKKYRPEIHDIYMVKSGATTGVTAMVDGRTDFNIWSPLAAIRCNAATIEPVFALHYLRSKNFQEGVALNWSFGTQQNIGMGVLGDLPIPVPPLSEQREIMLSIKTRVDGLAALQIAAEDAIPLLKERRSALIAAAVTGKIDVRQTA
ncbi:MAG: restriction endonuclease subunit S [Rhodanobacter sp.]